MASDLEELLGAIARGWTHPENSHKVMDEDLAEAICDEVLPLIYRKIDTVVAENERLREALSDIFHASRDDGLPAMCNWMRGRAVVALSSPAVAALDTKEGE